MGIPMRRSCPLIFAAALAAGVSVWLTWPLSVTMGAPASVHFKVGERLTYGLSWGIVTAGTAVLEVAERQSLSGRSVVKLIHTARSNEFVSAFYPVNNRVESLLDEEAAYPHRLLFNRREGKRKNDIEVIFDQAAHKATVTKDGNTETMEVPPDVQDTLSVIYFFRTLRPADAGSSTIIHVNHDKKNYRLELRVEGTERLKGPLGEFDTVRILAIMPFRGLFMNEGNIRVWITNDAARVPVLMKAKVIIGSITATLTGAEGVTLTAKP
ncbi:MAG: DUF3108 domain-containing protein [Nitrospirota bacterium]